MRPDPTLRCKVYWNTKQRKGAVTAVEERLTGGRLQRLRSCVRMRHCPSGHAFAIWRCHAVRSFPPNVETMPAPARRVAKPAAKSPAPKSHVAKQSSAKQSSAK